MAKFYKCQHCPNEVLMVVEAACTPKCCGEPMLELKENTVEGVATEKHIPIFEVKGNELHVAVGSTLHPMLEAHYIEWIFVETDKNQMIHHLKPGEEPKAVFGLAEGEKVKKVSAYCNLHGLWTALA